MHRAYQHTPFFKLYDTDAGIVAPHDALLPVTSPPLTEKPVGTVEMRDYNGLDAVFYFPSGTTNYKFKYEIWYYYKSTQSPRRHARGQTGRNEVNDAIYLPALVATAAVDNLIGTRVGLANGIVDANDLFADTLLATMALAYHGTGLQTALYGTTPGAATPEIVALSNSTADGIAILHLRHITADWVRIHVYKGATTSYVTANVLVRLLDDH